MGFFLVIILVLPLLDIAWWRWADRWARGKQSLRWAIAIFALAQICGFALLMAARGWRLNVSLPRPALAMLYLWHLLALPIFALSAATSWIVTRARRRQTNSVSTSPVAASTFPINRREFLLSTTAIAAPPLLAGVGLTIALPQLDSFRIRRLTIPLADLPPELDGMTIAQVSDVHVGRFTRASLLPRVAEATNQLRADLVLLTGDLIDWSLNDLQAGVDMVRALDPRCGLCMIEGNHDLFQSRQLFDERVRAAGIDLLLNEARTVRVRGREVQLLGIRWGGPKGERGPMSDEHLAATLPLRANAPDAFPILMAHHPHAFDAAAAAGIPLTLAGHTHGGQLMLTDGFGAGSLMYRYWSGLYQRGASSLVVSNGVGNWFPLRINAPAEIVHLTLRRA